MDGSESLVAQAPPVLNSLRKRKNKNNNKKNNKLWERRMMK